MHTTKRILIVAGGTGGHVMPGLAVADTLRQHYDMEVAWLGTTAGIEAELVPKAGIPLFTLQVRALRGKRMLQRLFGLWCSVKSCYQAAMILHKYKPNLVLGFGGFVSGPGGLMATLLRIPLVVHEQNAVAGLTNRILGRIAGRVLQAFPHTFPAHYRAQLTGNPVRHSIVDLPRPEQRWRVAATRLRVLILGGSLGANVLNETLPVVFAQLSADERPVIWHQTGKLHVKATQTAYHCYGVSARVEAFIDDMANAYAWAELVICRAGALTIAELSAAGVASILIPFPHAVDDHQTANANHLVQCGAAILLPQPQVTVSRLLTLLRQVQQPREQLLQMGMAAYGLPAKQATRLVAQHCVEMLR